MAGTVTNISDTVIIPKGCRERVLRSEADGSGNLRALGVLVGGISDLVEPYRIRRRSPDFHVVIFTTGGAAGWRVDGGGGRFSRGGVRVFPAGRFQEYWAIEKWSMFWLHLDDSERWSFLREEPELEHAARWGTGLRAAMDAYIGENLRQDAETGKAILACSNLISVFLAREFAGHGTAGAHKTWHRLNALREKIDGALQEKWTVESLAGLVNCSETHLNRLVMESFDTTPMGMVTDLRMRRAEELLRHTDYPLKTIADMIGYETPFAFSKAFKRRAGRSPREYRKTSMTDDR